MKREKGGGSPYLAGGFLRGRDGSEPLLARCVPDLQLHPLAVDVDRSDFKVNADGGDVAACSGKVETCMSVYTRQASAPEKQTIPECLGLTKRDYFCASDRQIKSHCKMSSFCTKTYI